MSEWWEMLASRATRTYSQYGEDGVLQAIFEAVGTTSKYLVDIGAGDGIKLSNTRVFLERGWHGARFDVGYAADVYQERITAENVCDILAKYNVPVELDLLSLDIDGIDWYVLRALLRVYSPRVFVCEVNPTIPAEPCVTVVYDPAFAFGENNYFGGSLGAFSQLARAHDYMLIYVHEAINAFFLRRDVATGIVHPDVRFETRPSWPVDPYKRPWHLITEEEYH